LRRKRKILRGMPEIEKLTQMDEATIRKCVRSDGFPAAIVRGRWRAIEEDILKWLREQVCKKSSV